MSGDARDASGASGARGAGGASPGFMSMRPALLHTKRSIMNARNISPADRPETRDISIRLLLLAVDR